MRGIWGFDGSHPPHGDRLPSLRRRVPTMTVVIDGPPESRRWLDLLDELTPVARADHQRAVDAGAQSPLIVRSESTMVSSEPASIG